MNQPIDPSKPIEYPLPGVDFCFEPLPQQGAGLIKGPPVTSLDHVFAKLPKDEKGRAWARSRLAAAPVLLHAARLSMDRGAQADLLMELALCHFLVGELAEGRSRTEQAISLWEQLADGRMVRECMMRAGHFYQTGGDVQAAIAYFERVLTCRVPAPTFRPEAHYNVLLVIAELRAYQDEYSNAADALGQALDVALRARLGPQAQEARLGLCTFLIKASRWQEALDPARQALAAVRARGDRRHEQTLRFLLADIHKELGQHSESAQHYEELLRQARAARAPRTLMIEILMKAGSAWRHAGQPALARTHFQEALPLADAETSRPLGVVARLNLSTLACEEGKPQRALDLADEALPRAPLELRPLLLLAKAEAHMSLKQWEQAAQAFQQALALARQRGDAEQEAALLTRLSVLLPRGEEEAATAN